MPSRSYIHLTSSETAPLPPFLHFSASYRQTTGTTHSSLIWETDRNEMVLDQLKSSFKKWRGSTSREQRIIPEEISLKGTSASLCADEGKSLFYCITVITTKLQKRLHFTKLFTNLDLAPVKMLRLGRLCQSASCDGWGDLQGTHFTAENEYLISLNMYIFKIGRNRSVIKLRRFWITRRTVSSIKVAIKTRLTLSSLDDVIFRI